MIITGTKGRRSAESRGGPKAGGGVQGGDGASDRNCASMGGSREAEAIDEAQEQMEREQQEEMQARAQAVTVTQGGGTLGPSTAVAVLMPRACERCTVLLQEPEECVVSERGKARACLPCQKAHKACVWPLGAGGAGVATGSRTEASEEEGGEDCDERVTQRWGEAQEGAHDNGGGRGQQQHQGGVWGAKGDSGGAARCTGDADPGIGAGGGEDGSHGGV